MTMREKGRNPRHLWTKLPRGRTRCPLTRPSFGCLAALTRPFSRYKKGYTSTSTPDTPHQFQSPNQPPARMANQGELLPNHADVQAQAGHRDHQQNHVSAIVYY